MTDWTGQFDAHLTLCPPINDAVLAQVPAKRGLLLLAGEADLPLILLTAADLRARLRGRLVAPADGKPHARQVDWRQITQKVLWKLADSHFETDLHYLAVARLIWPDRFAKMLAWRPARFVHVDPAARTPHFAKVNRLMPPPGTCVGPFPSARAAQGFIDAVEDAFDLCRDSRRLAQSPRARPCAYRQMGRCLGVCEGAIDMDTYRATVARAAAFATGDRQPFLRELEASMKQAAAELRFEAAAATKTRLDRLHDLEAPAYDHVADGQAFQFILVQRARRKTAKVFLADRGLIVSTDPLAYPPNEDQLSAALARMADLAHDASAPGRYDPWRVALVASYLLAGPQRRGLIVRWHRDLTPAQLGSAVEASAEVLGLVRRPRTGNTDDPSPSAGPSTPL